MGAGKLEDPSCSKTALEVAGGSFSTENKGWDSVSTLSCCAKDTGCNSISTLSCDVLSTICGRSGQSFLKCEAELQIKHRLRFFPGNLSPSDLLNYNTHTEQFFPDRKGQL